MEEGLIRKTKRFGQETWENSVMDRQRKENSLCYNCSKINFCGTAADIYSLAVENTMAFIITRCKDFKWKTEGGSEE